MKKFLPLIALSLCTVLFLCACTPTKKIESTKLGSPVLTETPTGGQYYAYLNENALDDEFSAAIVDFAFKTASTLFVNTSGEDANKNYNYSPASLYFALCIATAGANGNTKSQLKEYLCAQGFTDAFISQQMGKLFRLLYNSTENNQVEIANSLWLSNNMPVKQTFIDNAVDNYYAELFEVNFSLPQAALDMSNWVYNKTHGKLKPAFETDALTLLFIINTVYFCSYWSTAFDKTLTEKDDFNQITNTTDANTTVECDFMHRTSAQSIVFGDNYSRISLSFANGATMNIVLPDADSFYEILNNADLMQSAFYGGVSKYGEVEISLPKFTFTNKYLQDDFELEDFDAFSPLLADFSGISDIGSYISLLAQETFIEVSEEKVEAAAYTAIGDKATSAEPVELETYVFDCDHPFMYSITYNGAVLFMGVVLNPVA